MALSLENRKMVAKLAIVAAGMFGFGYLLIPLYKQICEVTGINILATGETQVPGAFSATPNTQVDTSRTITVIFDANAHGLWAFRPEQQTLQVHPGQLAQVMYDFQNTQPRRMSAQAIPSYAPRNAAPHFNKLECFCFNQYTLQPGESKRWPVVFVIDPKLPKDVTTITLSYTFFEVGGKAQPAPATAAAPPQPEARS